MTDPFGEVATEYAEAEQLISRSGHQEQAVLVPPVNELRYAGYHILKAIQHHESGDAERRKDELDKAQKHCRRSIFDTSELLLSDYYESIIAFRKKFVTIQFRDHVTNYDKHKKAMSDARDFMEREKPKSRDQYHEEALHHAAQLSEAENDFLVAQDDLAEVLADQKKTEGRYEIVVAREGRRFWLMVGSIVFGAVSTVIAVLQFFT